MKIKLQYANTKVYKKGTQLKTLYICLNFIFLI